MPSLRRTFSSPVVRSSPYPSYTPSSALYSSSRAQGGHGHRRSSGLESSNRRVLADIEWWRVADGQHVDQGNDSYQVENAEQQGRDGQLPDPPGSVVTSGPVSTESLFSSWVLPNSLAITMNLLEEPSTPPTDQFAELSLRPRTPGNDSSDSVASSLLATPESAFLPLEGLSLDYGNPRGPSSSQKRNRSVTMPVFPTKTKLFDDLLFNDVGGNAPYADFSISPLSSHSPLLLN